MPVFARRADLLPRFREGDSDALAEVYWAYVDKITAIARHGLTTATPGAPRLTIPPAEVADLVQDIFIRAFTPSARAGFDGLRDYGPYLYGIARHAVLDWARKRGREPPTDYLPPDVLASVAEVPASDEDDGDADPQTLAVVRGYLQEVEPKLRAVHLARYERGLSQRDAADHLGITRQSLRTLEDRLRKGVRRALKLASR
jgi:RNA polymerase sigma factor (sigma-70 family)